MLTVNHIQAKSILAEVLRKKRVPIIHGPPGIGKSDLIKQVAAEYGLKVIDLRLSQCDPTDLNGMPYVNEVKGKAGYLPMDTFPVEGDPIPTGFNGWLLFLDEITSALPAIQAAAYKLILDRMVGQFNLHPCCLIAAAGNRIEDGAVVEEMSTALQSRMIHMELALDVEVWMNWAFAAGIDHRITDYLKWRPDAAYTFTPDHTDRTYACPRTWEFAHDWIVGHTTLTLERIPILAGTLSEGVAREFVGFTQVYANLPKIHDIEAMPTIVPVPTDPPVLWALTGHLAQRMTPANADALMQYIERMGREFQMITMKDVLTRATTETKQALKATKGFQRWLAKNGTELF